MSVTLRKRIAAAASDRIRSLLLVLWCWPILGVSFWLTPDERGYGTAEQLGLPACNFLVETRWPCPTCGLTTSMAATAHGRFRLAFWAHPFGVVLFAAIAILALAGGVGLVCGDRVVEALRVGVWWLVAGAVALLVGWGLKLLVGWATGRLPVP